jgi:hypothetical protein
VPSNDELDGEEAIEGHVFVFEIGKVAGEYYQVNKEVLGLEFELFLSRDMKLERKSFIAHRDISIFARFNSFELDELKIGGGDLEALPREVFESLIRKFPTSTELDHYARSRISAIIRNYLPVNKDFEFIYEKYLNKKASFRGSSITPEVAPYESEKFTGLVNKIEFMLLNAREYNEAQWQDEILQVVLLLFPRYVKAFKEGPVNDSWANKTRKVDFLLIDSSGYIDVIEIKKPSEQHLLSVNKYRDNYVPLRELGGAIMQVEKYIYHFGRWGKTGEAKLMRKYEAQLPDGLEIKIVNPKGFLILGRDWNLTDEQKSDFEVIRRKYRNVVDIITYDDLVRRLKIIRDNFITIHTDSPI